MAAAHNEVELKYDLINADDINDDNISSKIDKYDGVLILPGFGIRGFEAKVRVAQYTRTINKPTLGICLGFQAMASCSSKIKRIQKCN
ncbi:glutamine amidotransferase-related protein [Mycoplasmopsis cynos]|uniref:glutamine amidotransferase-related protein n=1 Tax=Mycoplasmopsis cynos TaxID=171284 RepID=UPI0024C84F5D|nr:hypothetical protein [Mycoplasmopsis cynos]WAM10362.1 hypothetical protein ONA24_02565 [Mycoplasmopsis cynos]